MHNLIATFKHHPKNMGSTNCIIMFKTFNLYDYIQDNYFPRLYFRENVYLFKMLVNGDGCGITLMK